MQALWRPSPEQIARSNMKRFMDRVRPESGADDYAALHDWSIQRPDLFWAAVWEDSGILSSCRWDQVVDDAGRMPGAKWFAGARLNFAENLLRRRDDRPALVFWNEEGPRLRWSYRELFEQVGAVSSALRAAGVERGDRVAGYLPNCPQAAAAMLATAAIGAIWSSCSPDFGVKGVLDRFGQIQPKVLFTSDGYIWSGKRISTLDRIGRILEEIPAIRRLVVVPYLEDSPPLDSLRGAVLWDDFRVEGAEPVFESLPFDHPLYILYSSGTTGLPKCMVHGAGGTLIQHLKELRLHSDLTSEDRIFYYTTCGWMMWNWLISSLAVGATILLYDGSPFAPRKDILFDFAEQEGMTVFGTSAKFLALAQKEGLRPAETHDLSALGSMLSTGSVLAPEGFDYVYRDIKPDLRLSSISGGTDIVSCFALGNPILPVHRGELQCIGLGMSVEVFDEAGASLPPGQKGELVCTRAFPSMPVHFWNDPDGSRYQGAYFDHFPGVWRHGDWVELSAHGGLIIHGRSDATLNPGGVRIGTAEIYRQVEQLEEILESLVIGQEWEGDMRIVLFVRLRDPQAVLDQALEDRIRQQIRANTSPHHVPKKIVQVTDIPRTISGKITELAVREIVHGRPVKNVDALANPQALEQFRDRNELGS